MFDKFELGPGARFLLILAAVVVVVAGLRVAQPILLPFALAVFLAILSLPVMMWLQRRRVPTGLAILLTMLVNVAILGVVVLLAIQSVSGFQEEFPRYRRRLEELYHSWLEALTERGIPVAEYLAQPEIAPMDWLMTWAGEFLGAAATVVGTAFLVILIMLFILAEAAIFPEKFRAIFGQEEGEAGRFAKVTGEVQEYLLIKTLVSLATGVCIGLWAWVMGLDFPVLLGLIGFVLNYVPTIGSVLAAAPAMVLALVMGGVGLTVAVGLGYLVINIIFGNLIEPSLLGRRLGLSTLVVILSLIFWAWVWGPVGALLAVPLTMIVKIMLENTQDLRWAAILLDKEAPVAVPQPGPPPPDYDAEA